MNLLYLSQEKYLFKVSSMEKKNIHYMRFYSQMFQVYLVKRLGSKEILEIGKGDMVVTNFIERFALVTTLDNDINKCPHIHIDVSNFEDLDTLPNDFYETILICEVLEHVPYEKVEKILQILKKKVKDYIIISVPDQSKYLHAEFFKHGIRNIHFFMTALNWFLNKFNMFWKTVSKFQYTFINKRRTFKKQKEHKWELGIDKYSVKKFKIMLEKHFKIILDKRVKEFPWHHFYVLGKKI